MRVAGGELAGVDLVDELGDLEEGRGVAGGGDVVDEPLEAVALSAPVGEEAVAHDVGSAGRFLVVRGGAVR